MESSILEALIPWLNGVSMVAFWGWFSADKRAEVTRKEMKEFVDAQLARALHQATQTQRVADMLDNILHKLEGR